MSAVDLDDLKAQLNITRSNDDGELQRTLDAAERWAGAYLGAPLGVTTRTYAVYPSGRQLVLPAIRLAAVTALTDPDGNPVDLEPFRVNLLSGVIDLPYGGEGASHGGRRHYGITGRPWTVVAAFADTIPEDLRLAVLIIAGHLWQTQRVAGQGEGRPPGFGGTGGGAPTAGGSTGFAIPNRAQTLLDPYRLPVIA